MILYVTRRQNALSEVVDWSTLVTGHPSKTPDKVLSGVHLKSFFISLINKSITQAVRYMFLQANIDMHHINEKKLQEKIGKWYSKPLYRKLVQRCIGREYSCEKRMKLSIYSSTFNDPSIEEEEEVKQVVSANIPNDVLVDMLSRFPARALMRLKCVGKNWRSVIQDPVFVNLHLTLAKETGMGLIQTLEDTGFRIYSIDDFGFATELHSLVTDNSYPRVSSCNGLLCFLDSSDDMLSFLDNSKEIRIRLCNPITGETMTITKPYCFQRKTAGLGYDTCSQKYKVVCCSESEVEVYTIGSESNSWRTIKCPSGFTINFLEKPIYSHGNLHWKASISDHANGFQHCAIVAFDMSDEKFSLVKGPDINAMNGNHWLCELEGSLSLVQAYDKKVILWVLKDYEEQVWMKKSVYRLPFYPSWPEGFMTIRNNKILFESREDECDYVCHYDEQGQLLKVIKVTGLPSSFKNYIDNHVESLVSFKYT